MNMTDFEDRKVLCQGQLAGFGPRRHHRAVDPVAARGQGVRSFDDYNAMTLSTVGRRRTSQCPHCAVALLWSRPKQVGWSVAFYTNYHSAKGQELSAHPPCGGHVLLECPRATTCASGGPCELRCLAPRSQTATLPPGRGESQIGAWASAQSQQVADRKALEASWEAQNNVHSQNVPRPPHWGRLPATHSAG